MPPRPGLPMGAGAPGAMGPGPEGIPDCGPGPGIGPALG